MSHFKHSILNISARLATLAGITLLTVATHADAYTYTYTGTAFTTEASPPYTSSDFVSGSFTVASPLVGLAGSNTYPISYFTSQPSFSYSFSDGVNTYTNSNGTFLNGFNINVTLGPSGSYISDYAIQVNKGPSPAPYIFFEAGETTVSDYPEGVGIVYGPGKWTGAAAPVPEPETYAMLLAGLGMLGFMVSREKSV